MTTTCACATPEPSRPDHIAISTFTLRQVLRDADALADQLHHMRLAAARESACASDIRAKLGADLMEIDLKYAQQAAARLRNRLDALRD